MFARRNRVCRSAVYARAIPTSLETKRTGEDFIFCCITEIQRMFILLAEMQTGNTSVDPRAAASAQCQRQTGNMTVCAEDMERGFLHYYSQTRLVK